MGTHLSNFTTLWNAYPTGEKDVVKALIGGEINADWIANTCVIRMSRCLNYGGHPIPGNAAGLLTVRGGDGLRYALRVREFQAYLRGWLGAPQKTATAATPGIDPALVSGVTGIIAFDVPGWSDATGHMDLWDGARCVNHGYFELATGVSVWAVSDELSRREPPRMPTLSASVGEGGANKKDDVSAVQALLTRNARAVVPLDGRCDATTLAAIRLFQGRFMTAPDGRIDPRGRTWRELNGLG